LGAIDTDKISVHANSRIRPLGFPKPSRMTVATVVEVLKRRMAD
jgi:hypothetical protein